MECVSALGNAFQHSEMGVKMENFENFFCFFDFLDRFYINTYAPDLSIAARPARGLRSAHFILSPKVDVI